MRDAHGSAFKRTSSGQPTSINQEQRDKPKRKKPWGSVKSQLLDAGGMQPARVVKGRYKY